jgi:tetratricopeptide (TPR) repeat protein
VLLRSAVAGWPDRPELWGALSAALLAVERPEEALAAAGELVVRERQDEWGYRLSALALSGLGRHKDAVRAAAAGVRLAPLAWETHQVLASALTSGGRYEEAWPVALHAVSLAPEGETGAHLTVGAAAMGCRDWRHAEQAYRQVLSIEPDNARASECLALLAVLRGRVKRAADGFADAAATDPRGASPGKHLELTALTAVRPLLFVQGLAAGAGWLAASREIPGVVGAAAIGGASAVVVATAVWLWRSVRRPVRGYLRMMLRTDEDLRGLAGFGTAGLLLLCAAAGLLLGGSLTAAKAASAIGGVCTLAAFVNGLEQALGRGRSGNP